MTLPSVMRAVEISTPGGPEALRPVERALPELRDDEILIEVRAAGVNRPDALQRQGLYPPIEGESDLPGLEVAGVVAARGSKANRFALGARVCALLPGGGYAEYAAAREGSTLPVPDGFDFRAAAALPETYFTVWSNVFEIGALKAGERLLVHGGTSGIGMTAIALAKSFDATVFATASAGPKLDAMKERGADAAFRYDEEGWDEAIRDAGGVDVALDMTGGDFFARNLSCLRPGGRHVSIAFLRGNEGAVDIFALMRKRLTITGSTLRSRNVDEKAALAARIEARLWPLLARGEAAPVIDETFPLKEASAAHARMEAGAHIGKILLDPTH